MATKEVGPIVSNVIQTLTDAATIDVDGSNAFAFALTLGGNRTLNAPSNLVTGSIYIFKFIQGGSGSYNPSFSPVGYGFPSGAAPALSTLVGSIDVMVFWSDGTMLHYIELQKDSGGPLTAPSSLVGSSNVAGHINFTWTNNDATADGTYLQQQDDIAPTVWDTIATIAYPTALYNFTIDPGVYNFRVIAYKRTILSAASNIASGTSL